MIIQNGKHVYNIIFLKKLNDINFTELKLTKYISVWLERIKIFHWHLLNFVLPSIIICVCQTIQLQLPDTQHNCSYIATLSKIVKKNLHFQINLTLKKHFKNSYARKIYKITNNLTRSSSWKLFFCKFFVTLSISAGYKYYYRIYISEEINSKTIVDNGGLLYRIINICF